MCLGCICFEEVVRNFFSTTVNGFCSRYACSELLQYCHLMVRSVLHWHLVPAGDCCSLFPLLCDFSCFSGVAAKFLRSVLLALVLKVMRCNQSYCCDVFEYDLNTKCCCPVAVWRIHWIWRVISALNFRIQVWCLILMTWCCFLNWVTTTQSSWTGLLSWITPLEETFLFACSILRIVYSLGTWIRHTRFTAEVTKWLCWLN